MTLNINLNIYGIALKTFNAIPRIKRAYKAPLPEMILYKMMITAMTSKTWIRLLVPIPGIISSNPRSQITIQTTATSHKIFLIIL